MDLATFKARLGANLRAARWKAGLTHEQIEGVTMRYYQDLEAGRRNPSIEVLWQLAQQFGVAIADLVNVPGGRPQSPSLDKIQVEPLRRGRKPKSHPRSR